MYMCVCVSGVSHNTHESTKKGTERREEGCAGVDTRVWGRVFVVVVVVRVPLIRATADRDGRKENVG